MLHQHYQDMVISYKKAYINYFGYLLSLVIFISVIFLFINSNISGALSNKGLTLSPLRSEVDIAPGTSVGGSLTITNSTDSDMRIYISAEEFKVNNQQYDYKFTPESDLTSWISYKTNDVSLEARKSSVIKYQIGVPLSAEPGGRYIGLFASTDTKGANISVNSRQRVASLLYINVTGDVTRKGELMLLDYPWLIVKQSQWGMSLQNKGTTHFRSRYNVSLKNLIDDDIVVERSGDALILPGSTRSISDQTLIPKFPGIYKVLINVGLGDTPSKSETRLVLYLPLYAIFMLVVVLILFIILIRRKRKH